MAQQTHGVSGTLPHHHDAIDQTNREAFEENWQIIKTCWTEEMLTFKGKYWKVPAGATPWDLETTVKYGKGVENGHADVGRRGAEAVAETVPAGVPAVRVVA